MSRFDFHQAGLSARWSSRTLVSGIPDKQMPNRCTRKGKLDDFSRISNFTLAKNYPIVLIIRKSRQWDVATHHCLCSNSRIGLSVCVPIRINLLSRKPDRLASELTCNLKTFRVP